jgi:predicted RNase H-like HicB family nuclease
MIRRRQAGKEAKPNMHTIKIVLWEDNGAWLGYLQDYPDYQTQGETPEDLREHLKDLYQDVTSGALRGIRKVEDLVVP